MTTFTYTAVRANGETFTHTIEAKDRFEVYGLVRKEGATILDIEEKTSRFLPRKWFSTLNSFFSSVKTSEKIILARNLSTMIKAGLPISRSLSVVERQTKNKKLRVVLASVNADIVRGISFHEALEKHPSIFSSLFISMVRAGEESGKLAEALLMVAGQMERAYTLRKKIRGALIYPSIIVIAMIGIGIIMMIYVVPTLSQTFNELGIDLPRSTKIVIGVSDFLTHNTILSLSLILLLVLGFIWSLRTTPGRRAFEFFILHLPIINTIVKETNAARTSRTLASLLSAGVEIVEALEITRDVLQNSYYKEVLAEAGQVTKKGQPVAEAFIAHEGLYPVLMGEMMAVGGETGQLSKMLDEIATFFEFEVEQKTKDLSTVIEPFLMLFIGTVVGFFAVSMITPIYSISSGI